MKVQSVWPGGWVELPGFEVDDRPLVVLAGPRGRQRDREKVHRLEACATESRAGKKPPPAWLEGYLKSTRSVKWSRS